MADDPNTPLDPWYGDIAGEDQARQELLGQYESSDAFFEDFSAVKNRNWRDDFVPDGDDKAKSQLERFNKPVDFYTSFQEAQQTIRKGQKLAQLPEDATEEQIKEFRSSNGIPLEAAGYLKDLPEGVVVGDDDKELMGSFFEKMHGHNLKPEVGHEIITWYNELAEQQQDARATLDIEQHKETEDVLRESWKGDYRTNVSLIQAMVSSTFGEKAADQLMNGRYQDGRAFMNDPDVLEGMTKLARMVNDNTLLIPPDQDVMATIEDRIAEIEKYMREKRTAYNKDIPVQNELRDLYGKREKMKEKQNAA